MELERFPGPYRLGSTGQFGCQVLYLLVRAARPRIVVETGVLYGASSSHILAALECNGQGKLYSIDLARDDREPSHDFFIPGELKPRWHLTLGDSRRKLPPLLARLNTIDLFHHDSLHTFGHMIWEYETAFGHLAPGGVLSSDDVLVAHSLRAIRRKNAFVAFCERRRNQWATFGNFGVVLRGLPAALAASAI